MPQFLTGLILGALAVFGYFYFFAAPETTEKAAPDIAEKPEQAASTAPAFNRGPAASEAPAAYIITPADGATVSSPVTVRFGLKGMGVAPAGTGGQGTGHHHLLVDTGLPDLSQPIPADDNHIHFGGGQTQTTVELEPGTHTLQLLLGDQNHVPHDPPVMSDKITVTVE